MRTKTSGRPWVIGLSSFALVALSTQGVASAGQPPTSPADPLSGSGLSGVSAVSSSDVWAVGAHGTETIATETLAEHWDGLTWTRFPSPNLGVSDSLFAVSAVSTDDVWAVGRYDEPFFTKHALIEHWDGQAWTVVPFSDPGVTSALSGVSAVSATDVWAVGQYQDATTLVERHIIEHWDGAGWSLVRSSPVVHSRVFGGLAGISADSASDAWTVAEDRQGGVERWNGHGWGRQKGPDLRPDLNLTAVNARTPTDVWAVGWGPKRDVIVHWNGTTWTRSRPRGHAFLEGVCAISAGNVWAVGATFYGDEVNWYRPLIEHWDGARWTVDSGSRRPFNGVLKGATAISASDVWTVGSVNYHVLIKHFDGTSWTRF